MHRWRKEDETGEWFIICEKEDKDFSPRCPEFDDKGRCPHCGESAEKELKERRKRKLEKQREKEEREKYDLKNTLGGYF